MFTHLASMDASTKTMSKHKQPARTVHREPHFFDNWEPEDCSECGKLTRYWLTPHVPLCQECAAKQMTPICQECGTKLDSSDDPSLCPRCETKNDSRN